MNPQRPTTLPLLAEAILAALSDEPLAGEIVLGGGVALKHYDDFRPTQDIDAWWRETRDAEAMARFREVLDTVAAREGLDVSARRFGATDSFEFRQKDGKKVFSFQIAVRDVSLDAPFLSSWPPVLLESLGDNIGSKMNALVNRGAPRDFLDVHRVVVDGLMDVGACWELWRRKNEGADRSDAKGQVATHLARLELRRPLVNIVDVAERESANRLRRWYGEEFLQ